MGLRTFFVEPPSSLARFRALLEHLSPPSDGAYFFNGPKPELNNFSSSTVIFETYDACVSDLEKFFNFLKISNKEDIVIAL